MKIATASQFQIPHAALARVQRPLLLLVAHLHARARRLLHRKTRLCAFRICRKFLPAALAGCEVLCS